MKIVIRSAQAEDFEQIAELDRQIFGLHYKNRPDMFNASYQYSREHYRDILDNQDQCILVARQEAGEPILGYAEVHILKRGNAVYNSFVTVYIESFGIADGCRRMGAGTKLFYYIKKLAAEVKARNIELNVWKFNTGAVEFYKSVGLQEQCIRMELTL